ncbi:MAG: hypothetical protein GXO64_02285 [Candidatus Micrarchaeota archaeon]|nr:hypothetical protein [Candidatus Micrarchaeota archaeon]
MRRDPLEIIEEILEILERSHCAMSMNAIARETGLHNITVKRYVEIIEKIKGDNIEIIRTDRSVILRCNVKNKDR